MGYDLHITRRKNWSEAGRDISIEEWLAYVQKDDELSLSLGDGPGFAKWSGKSKLPDPWLDWSSGNVYTKNPDGPLVDKMLGFLPMEPSSDPDVITGVAASPGTVQGTAKVVRSLRADELAHLKQSALNYVAHAASYRAQQI